MQRYNILCRRASELAFFFPLHYIYIKKTHKKGGNVPPFCPPLRHFVYIVEQRKWNIDGLHGVCDKG